MTGLYGFLDGNYLFFVTYPIVSVITFALTYHDKQQAKHQRPRWAERTLHLWDALWRLVRRFVSATSISSQDQKVILPGHFLGYCYA